MPVKDLHEEPFDETTLLKLDIFKSYTEKWLPTFIHHPAGFKEIAIFDFFAGTGYDKVGKPGSAILTLQVINNFKSEFEKRPLKVKLILNEFSKPKCALLSEACNQFLIDNPWLDNYLTIEYESFDFQIVFEKYLGTIEKLPSLVLLDQNGVKFTKPENIRKLAALKQVDFLFFISSGYLKRYNEVPAFSEYVKDISEDIKSKPYRLIHRIVLEHNRKITKDTKSKLYAISLKKNTNIYGIIFGASHPIAVEKFLDVAWSKTEFGDANFDIDEENKISPQLDLFIPRRLRKMEAFEYDLVEFIKESGMRTNGEIYSFTLEHGHPKKHATEILINGRGKKFDFKGQPKVKFETFYKPEDIVEIRIKK